MILKINILLFAIFIALSVKAQTITNIRVNQEDDNVEIIYDLKGDQSGLFNIEITVSNEYRPDILIIPKTLFGDIKNVSPGNDKKINWNVLSDYNELIGEGFLFKLNAKSNNPASNFSANSGTFTDERDGEVYKWVKIGTQIWMAENLKATKYNDGTAIPNVMDKTGWNKAKTGAYCWYNNETNNRIKYGAIYNWYTIHNGKLCPVGWSVPTDSEWTTLENYLGGSKIAGGKMKAVIGWVGPNTGATNSCGFSANPGGGRSEYGEFAGKGSASGWWSSTIINNTDSWGRGIGYQTAGINRFNFNKSIGFSVRCLR